MAETETLKASDLGLLSDEERHDYYEQLREVALEDAAESGFALPGVDPFAGEWQVNFDWPEKAGRWGGPEGETWIEDDINAEVVAGTFVVGKPYQKGARQGRVRESTLRRQSFDANDIRAMRETAGWENLKEWGGNPDPFAYGNSQALGGGGGVLGQYLPLWPGPVTRQLYWQDYWMMSAKAFEAYNHDPISWRMIHLKAEFALGRGLGIKITRSRGSSQGQTHDSALEKFNEYWDRNKMSQRLDTIARDYCWGGEQFLRYFKKGPKLTVRSLDPASIYDLITDPEDIETVFAYHQQFQAAYQLYPPTRATPPTGVPAPTGPSDPGAVTKYIIRQILPQEIDHYKSNSSAFERRGRSDLFPALGWIKRLRDYLTSHVIQADMLSRICWDLEVSGGQSAITHLRAQLFPNGQAPPPGTVFGHNSASKLEAIVPQQSGGRNSQGDPVLDALATMVSLSGGVPKDWLGFGLQTSRAGALVATQPASKALDQLQKTIEGIIHDGFNRAMAAAGVTDAQLEVIFPSIVSEDRKDKLDDLGTMEAMGYLSKRTSSEIAAKEMGITNYDFEAEQKLIAAEFEPPEFEEDKESGLLGPDGKPVKRPKQGDSKIRRQVILATKRQAPKLDVTKSPSFEDDPPGVLVPESGDALPAPGSQDGTGRTVPGGGSHGDSPHPMTASGAKDIRKEGQSLKESEEIVISPPALHWLLARERQAPRRKPDDPEFEEASQKYRQRAEGNLQELVDSARGHHD